VSNPRRFVRHPNTDPINRPGTADKLDDDTYPTLLTEDGQQLLRGFQSRCVITLAPSGALFAGNAAHAWTPLTRPPTSAVGLMFGAVAHRHGWPAWSVERDGWPTAWPVCCAHWAVASKPVVP